MAADHIVKGAGDLDQRSVRPIEPDSDIQTVLTTSNARQALNENRKLAGYQWSDRLKNKQVNSARAIVILCNVSYAIVMNLSMYFSLPVQYKAIIDTNCMCTTLLYVGVY